MVDKLRKLKMEEDKKVQNGKKLKMSKKYFKTTKGNKKWNMARKILMGDDQKQIRMEVDQK